MNNTMNLNTSVFTGSFGVEKNTSILAFLDVCFSDDFADIIMGDNTTTNGSGTAWAGNANFPTVDKAYQAGGAVKLGTGSAIGSIQSKELDDVEGDITVNIMVKGWTTVEGDLKVSIDGQEEILSYTALRTEGFEEVTATFTGVTAGSKLKIETTAKRAFIDSVEVLCEDTTPGVVYCTPEGTNANRYINNFSTTGGIQNISNLSTGFSAGGYGDFSATHTVEQIAGDMVNFSADIVGGTAGFRIWVDWNQDGVFSVTEEVAYHSTGFKADHTGSFVVPANALVGATRMRIVSHWLNSQGLVDPCIVGFTNGEFEDYTFVVTALEDCAGTPEGGSVTVAPSTGNPGATYLVSSENHTVGIGLSYQWQSNTDGAGWVNEGTASENYSAYTATAPAGIGVEVEWRLEVTCTFSTESAFSNTATFTTALTYCNPTISSTVEPITRVIFADIDNASPVNSTIKHEDFTSVEGNVELGETYDIALEGFTGGNYTNAFTVWIDWDQNGTFEATEMYPIGTIVNSTGTDGKQALGSIAVPAGATEGSTRMRVIKNFSSSPTNPCGSYSFGQIEDYTINIAAAGGGTGCEWTVIVFEDYFGDDVEWELRAADNTVLLSGGNYGFDYYDEQTITAEGPLEFFITTAGGWDDNEPNYSVSNENGVIVSGVLPGGGTATYSDLNCTDGPPPPPAYTCEDQTVPSNNLENGLFFNGTDNQSLAVDIIAGDTGFTTYGVELNVFTDGVTDLDFSFVFYADAAGLPGAQSGTAVGSVQSSTLVGTAFGFDVYKYVVAFDAPVAFAANTTSWMEVETDGLAWEATSVATLGARGAFMNNNTSGAWVIGTTELVYTMICEEFDVVIEEPDFDCFQGDGITASFDEGNGIKATDIYRVADDFIVDEDIEFTMRQITIDVLSMTDVTTATINIRSDATGSPGGVVETVTMAPSSSVTYNSAYGFPIRHLTFDLATPLVFTEGTYWLEPTMMNADSSTPYWLVTSTGSHGAIVQNSGDSGANWSPNTDGYQAVFFVAGECELVEDPIDYCTPEGTNSGRYIDNFSTTGGTQNISNLASGFSTGGYGDFFDTHTLEAIQGEEVDFTADFVGGTFGFRVWVDWNQDGVFDITEEVAYASSGYASSRSGSFEIPTDALLGTTRMRIVNHWLSTSGNIDPCATGFTYGEFEDYKVVVTPMPDCSGTPDGGTITLTPASGNTGTTYVVSSVGYTVANGMSYQWQSNTDGAGWIDEGTATTTYANYTATAPSEFGVGVEWRLEVTCTLSSETAYSDIKTFTTVMTYCAPTFSTVEAITRVVYSDIDNTSPAVSTVGYEDFTAIEGNVEQGEPYAIALEGNTNGNFKNYFTVWVDWNQNGTFETNEMYPIGMIENSTGVDGKQAVGTVIVPAGAPLGSTRMRVIKNFNSSPTNPCGSYSYGQAEDYTIIVAEGDGPGDTGLTCEDQTVPSNNLENGLFFGGDTNQRLAVDVVVGDNGFTVYGVELNVFTDGVTDLEFSFVFYDDAGGLPGAQSSTATGSVADSELIGNAFGYDVYKYTVAFDTPVAFAANSVSWMEVDTDGLAWEATTANTLGSLGAFMNDNTSGAWAIGTSEYVYTFICEELGVSDMNSFDFAYYPNPVKDVLNIKSQKEVKSVEVFNLTGQKVVSSTKVLNGQINVNALTAGTYVFKVILDDGQVETFKIIKK